MPFNRKIFPVVGAFIDGLSPDEQERVKQTCRESGPVAAANTVIELDALGQVEKDITDLVAKCFGPGKQR